MSEPLCFEDIQLGQRWQSAARTVTETDVVNFAGVTGDYNPLHVDHEMARETPFRQPIAHGLLGMALVAGLGSHSPHAQTDAFVGIREWQFLRPIFFGDAVHVVTEAISLKPKGRRRGQVIWKRQLVNQHGQVVQEGLFETLVAVRPSQEKRAAA